MIPTRISPHRSRCEHDAAGNPRRPCAADGLNDGILSRIDILAFVQKHVVEAFLPSQGAFCRITFVINQELQSQLLKICVINTTHGSFGFGIIINELVC